MYLAYMWLKVVQLFVVCGKCGRLRIFIFLVCFKSFSSAKQFSDLYNKIWVANNYQTCSELSQIVDQSENDE